MLPTNSQCSYLYKRQVSGCWKTTVDNDKFNYVLIIIAAAIPYMGSSYMVYM